MASAPALHPDIRRAVETSRDAWNREGHAKTANVVAKVLAAPFKAVGRGVKNVLFGRVAKSGPFRGARMVAVKGEKAWTPIDRRAFLGIKSGRVPGEAMVVQKDGNTIYLMRNFQEGGLVGAAKRNPLKAVAVGGGGYLVATSPTARGMVTGLIPKMPENPVSEEVAAQFATPSAAPVGLAKADWKPTVTTIVPKRV